ncbi:unnamed protein product, partial [Rotaria socialis]
LLLPARQFQVTSCLDSGNGLHIVQLKEIKPQYDLLEPVPVPNSSVQPQTKSKYRKRYNICSYQIRLDLSY